MYRSRGRSMPEGLATGPNRLNQSIELVSFVLLRIVSFVVVVVVAAVGLLGEPCLEIEVALLFLLSSARRLAAATASLRVFGVALDKSGVSSGGGWGGLTASISCFDSF